MLQYWRQVEQLFLNSVVIPNTFHLRRDNASRSQIDSLSDLLLLVFTNQLKQFLLHVKTAVFDQCFWDREELLGEDFDSIFLFCLLHGFHMIYQVIVLSDFKLTSTRHERFILNLILNLSHTILSSILNLIYTVFVWTYWYCFCSGVLNDHP